MNLQTAIQEQVNFHGTRRHGKLFDPVAAQQAVIDGIIVVLGRKDRDRRLAHSVYWTDGPWWVTVDDLYERIMARRHPTVELNVAARELVVQQAAWIVQNVSTVRVAYEQCREMASLLGRIVQLRDSRELLDYFGFHDYQFESLTTEGWALDWMVKDRLLFVGSDGSLAVIPVGVKIDGWMLNLLDMVTDQELVR